MPFPSEILNMNNFLFSLDSKSDEVIVSKSQRGSNKIIFIERIPRKNNEFLYNSVFNLLSISKSPTLEMKEFNFVDEICQMAYSQHTGKSLKQS